MKTMEVWKVGLIATIAALGFAHYPLLGVIVLAVAYAVYREAEIKDIAAKGWTFGKALAASVAVAIAAQIILTLIFGVSLKELVSAGGLPALIQYPAAVPKAALKETIAMIAVIGIGYLWFTSSRPSRRGWIRLAITVVLAVLAGQAFQAAYPRDPKDQAWSKESFWRMLDAGYRHWDSRKNNTTAKVMTKTALVELDTLTASFVNFEISPGEKIKLYPILNPEKEEAAVDLDKPVQAEPGSAWKVNPNEEQILGPNQAIFFPVVNREDPRQRYAMSLDDLRQALEGIILAPPEPPASAEKKSAAVSAQPAAVTATAKQESAKEDIVLATARDYVDSDIITNLGDVIQFGDGTSNKFQPFKSAEEVNNLLARIGWDGDKSPEIRLEPKKFGEKEFIGEVTLIDGFNRGRAPERVKLVAGSDRMIAIRKK